MSESFFDPKLEPGVGERTYEIMSRHFTDQELRVLANDTDNVPKHRAMAEFVLSERGEKL